VRIEGSIFFGAAQHVGDHLQRFREENPGQKHALFMVKSMNFVDLAGCDLWHQEIRERRSAGGDVYFHRPRSRVMEMFARTGLLRGLGEDHLFASKDQALREIYPRLDPAICRDCPVRLFRECRGAVAAQVQPQD